MNRGRVVLVLLAALVAGGALAWGTYSYLENLPVRTIEVPTRKVVVANRDLSLGSELGPDDLSLIDWPVDALPEGAFTDRETLAGRGLLASIVRHEPILPAKLTPEEAGSGLPPIIPHGQRAVSVRVNEVIGVAGYVLPGTVVDVVATASPGNDPERVTSKVVLSHVQVLAAGTRLERDAEGGKPVQVTVVTLLVSPEQAERLTLASTEGKIQLALRNPLDDAQPETPGVQTQALLGLSRPAAPIPRVAPPPAPPSPPTVEVIRGDKRETMFVG
ncbi:MAG: Flp pilus assembly protein CpaB [Acidimicrobiia bacterium]|nr:Flp pilus assembly protein CpaB [Acidimicrobiia bacterium]